MGHGHWSGRGLGVCVVLVVLPCFQKEKKDGDKMKSARDRDLNEENKVYVKEIKKTNKLT